VTPPNTPPVFCDECSSLALAELDGAPLCLACILAALEREAEPALAGRIEPLHLVHPAKLRSRLDIVQSASAEGFGGTSPCEAP
jgi:hypothetical protein